MDEARDPAPDPAHDPALEPRHPLMLRCVCGWETSGTEAEVVAATEEHGRRLHNMTPSRDEIQAMLVPEA